MNNFDLEKEVYILKLRNDFLNEVRQSYRKYAKGLSTEGGLVFNSERDFFKESVEGYLDLYGNWMNEGLDEEWPIKESH